MTNSESFKLTITDLAFIALMPGFFFYHTALGMGTINPVLGGYFSPISLVLLPFLLLKYIFEAKKNKHYISKVDLIFFLFILYLVLVIVSNRIFGADELIAQTEENIKEVVHFIDIFLIFRMSEFNSRGIRWVSIICLICMTAIIFNLSKDGFFYIKDQAQSINTEKVATYQGFSRSYFFTFIVIVPFVKSVVFRLILYFLGSTALFINGARTEFSSLLFIIFIIELFYAKHKLILLLAIASIITVTLVNADTIISSLPSNRVLELFDLSHSTSWESRGHLSSRALETIIENPFLGDYGSYIQIGGPGTYAHNILSAWVDLGFFGFILIISMIIFPIYFLCADIISGNNKTNSTKWILTFSLMVITLMLLLTSKTYSDMLIGAALGAYAKYRFEKKYA